ncbi:hypothetical protein IAT38_001359 [Cryptococcus sp. DSM 104549]
MDRTIYPGFSTGFNRSNNLPASAGIFPDSLPSITVQLTPNHAFSLFEPFTELHDDGSSTTYTAWLTKQAQEYAEKPIGELWEAIQRVADALELDWRLGDGAIITEKTWACTCTNFQNYNLLQIARLHQRYFQQHFEEPNIPIQPLQLYVEWKTPNPSSNMPTAAAAAEAETTGGGAQVSNEGAGQTGDQWELVGEQENEGREI